MDKRKADAKAKLKRGSSILNKPEVPVTSFDLKNQGKKAKAIDASVQVFTQFKATNVPIKKSDLKKVVETATKYKTILPLESLAALNTPGNRKNVSQVIDYIEPKVINFWKSQNMVPGEEDPLFKIKLLNLCIKVKKGKLRFTDNVVSKTQQFNDFLSLVEGCKLYIWNTKVNDCASYNTLPPDAQKERYSKIYERICNIANAPISKPADADSEGKEGEEGKEEKGGEESSANTESGGEATSGSGSEGASTGGSEGGSEGASEGASTEGASEATSSEGSANQTSAGESAAETTEGFLQDNIDFNKLSSSDYIYIFCTVLFIFSLFFIYIRYSK
jgi:hypothetical protein